MLGRGSRIKHHACTSKNEPPARIFLAGMIYAAERDSLLVLEVFHHVLHVAELGVQAAPLSHQAVELPPEVVDVGFKNGLQGLPGNSVTLLLEEAPFGLQHLVLLLQKAHLVDEGGKFVVEGLDLLPLLRSHLLDFRINIQLEGCQEALVDSHFMDATRWANREPGATSATESGPSQPKSTSQPIATTGSSSS